MNQPRRNVDWVSRSCWALAGISAAILAGLLYFAQPIGDDFCGASAGAVWPAMLHYYRESGGRWVTKILRDVIAERINLTQDYAAVLGALLILRLLAAYALARAVFDPHIGRRRCAVLSASFCLLYWSAMPAPGDSLFWLTGAIDYELAATGLMLFIAFLLSRRLSAARTIALAAGAVLLAGSHEVIAVLLAAILLGGCIARYRERRADWPGWVFLLAITIAGSAVELLAPGNLARAARTGGSHSLSIAAATTGLNLLAWTPRWALDATTLLAGSLVLLDPDIRLRPEWKTPSVSLRIILAAVPVYALIAGFAIPGWATAGLVPGRMLNWLYLVSLTGILANLLVWKSKCPVHISGTGIRSAVTVLLFGAMLATGNPWPGAADLALRIPHWAASRRDALAELAAHGHDRNRAVFPSLPPSPHLYFDYDVVNDPGAYPNRCVARYYGFESIVGPKPREWPDGAALSGRTFGLRPVARSGE